MRLTHGLPVDVEVTLTSSNTTIVSLAQSVGVKWITEIPLTVHPQLGGFNSQLVTLTASYAGQELSLSLTVVRPENLSLPPLDIVASVPEDPCAQAFVEGTSLSFSIKNVAVLADRAQLTYQWTVAGAASGATTASTLTIPVLPPAGTQVVVTVEVVNGAGLHARGTLQFTTVQERSGLEGMVHRLDCALRNLKEAHRRIPPWVPIENDRIVIDREEIEVIRTRAQAIVVIARQVAATAKAIEANRAAE